MNALPLPREYYLHKPESQHKKFGFPPLEQLLSEMLEHWLAPPELRPLLEEVVRAIRERKRS
jgi:hypothetical protein